MKISKIIFKEILYFTIYMDTEYLLNIKTIQAATFKQVIDALKEILMDVNLEIDETGIKIVAMDNTHIVLIHLKLGRG